MSRGLAILSLLQITLFLVMIKTPPALALSRFLGTASTFASSNSNLERHVIHHLTEESTTLTEAIRSCQTQYDKTEYTPAQLLNLGSIYTMSSEKYKSYFNSNESKENNHKPQRTTSCTLLPPQTYIRIHWEPRRFSVTLTEKNIIYINDHYAIINKPPNLPCHSTVDNRLENVLHQFTNLTNKQALLGGRLDHDTTGLCVLSLGINFLRYYNLLLRTKTERILGSESFTPIRKFYRAACLVNSQSLKINPELEIKHYLVNSLSAPKLFIEKKSEGNDLECKLIIKSVSDRIEIDEDVRRKWDVPEEWEEIVEVEIELLTGRTHQIRGQMKAMGMPLVGDRMYYDMEKKEVEGEGEGDMCLQAFRLEFEEPVVGEGKMGRKVRSHEERSDELGMRYSCE
ncbi:hypothetical protein TL16_g11222 [Triparma laevis f. inornata]|uniref:Pseudouridine synthase RsuA/RluA-like domain-containing protein n=1 Tax=Triparma laevis f. inornata TaxID=1714386 RepID=A0A9W7ESV8_9STRA|nr:hypothetical protein TL16_g11222 [Triparma laevis f. inornata]